MDIYEAEAMWDKQDEFEREILKDIQEGLAVKQMSRVKRKNIEKYLEACRPILDYGAEFDNEKLEVESVEALAKTLRSRIAEAHPQYMI